MPKSFPITSSPELLLYTLYSCIHPLSLPVIPFSSQHNFCLLDPELAITFKLGVFLTISRSRTGLSISFRKQSLQATDRNRRWIYTVPGSAWQSPSIPAEPVAVLFFEKLRRFYLFINLLPEAKKKVICKLVKTVSCLAQVCWICSHSIIRESQSMRTVPRHSKKNKINTNINKITCVSQTCI